MRKIFQNDNTKETGNCLQCCISTIFGWPLREIPNFIQPDYKSQREAYTAYMKSRGYETIHLFFKFKSDLEAFLERNELNEYVILGVSSFHYKDVAHAVVGHIYNDMVWVEHDPNPLNNPIQSDRYNITSLDLFIPLEEFYGSN